MTAAADSPEYQLLLTHSTTCRTCWAVDENGVNANLPCAAGDRIVEAYRQTLRGPAVPSRTGG